MAHDVFVSYSSKDKPVGDAVVAGLEHLGIRCWIAPRDITPGTSWGQEILNAIESARIMVIILSENSNQSHQVLREVERAVANEVIIIPFRIENISPTGAMAYFLSTEHWLDALTPPLDQHIKRLGNTIQLFMNDGGISINEELISKSETPPSLPIIRRWWPIGLGIALLSIVAVILFSLTILPQLIGQPAATEIVSPATQSLPTDTLLPPTPTSAPFFTVVGEYRTSGSAHGIFVNNDILNLANGTNGLLRISVAEKTDPELIDTYLSGDIEAHDVVVADEIAYIIAGDYMRKLVILPLDTTDESTTFPPEGETESGFNGLYNITVIDGMAHLTSHNYWGILNVLDPTDSQLLWTWEPPDHSGNPCNAEVDGNLAYISCGWAGLFIFDITDPEAPNLLGEFNAPHWVIDLVVKEKIIYLTLGEGGLYILDVSDPSTPLVTGRLTLPGFSSDLSIAGDTLYVIYTVTEDYVDIESGVIAIDVEIPESPAIIATYDQLFSGSDIQAEGDVVYVSDEPRGVIILSLGINE